MNLAEILASLQQQPTSGARGLMQPVNDPYSAIKKGLGDVGGPTEGARAYQGGASARFTPGTLHERTSDMQQASNLYHGMGKSFDKAMAAAEKMQRPNSPRIIAQLREWQASGIKPPKAEAFDAERIAAEDAQSLAEILSQASSK